NREWLRGRAPLQLAPRPPCSQRSLCLHRSRKQGCRGRLSHRRRLVLPGKTPSDRLSPRLTSRSPRGPVHRPQVAISVCPLALPRWAGHPCLFALLIISISVGGAVLTSAS